MTREPVYENGTLVGYNVHFPTLMIVVRDARGYEQLIPAALRRVIFEPIPRQGMLFDSDT
jgi:hypothetical protein